MEAIVWIVELILVGACVIVGQLIKMLAKDNEDGPIVKVGAVGALAAGVFSGIGVWHAVNDITGFQTVLFPSCLLGIALGYTLYTSGYYAGWVDKIGSERE